MQDLWAEELTEEQADALIDGAVEKIVKRGLSTPAILFFEMHKPLSYVGSQTAVAFSPFLVPFLGFDRVNDYTRLFAKRENVERLLERLERRADSAKGASEG